MRPAVHASILSRNRGPRRHMRMRQHVFSARRLLLMVFAGIMLLIPGLALTVVGLENSEADYEEMGEAQRVMYQAIGPAMCTVGAAVMFASCIYFYCYGTGPQASSPTPNNQHQSLSEHEQDNDKGSIRSKHSHHGHHHHHHHHHHVNGRAVEVHTPDSECRRSFRGEDGSFPNAKAPHRTSGTGTTEEEVPLAKMEDSSILSTKGQQLAVPTVLIHIQAPSDTEDFDWADDVSMDRISVDERGKPQA